MEKFSSQMVMLLMLVANASGCLASYIREGGNWTAPSTPFEIYPELSSSVNNTALFPYKANMYYSSQHEWNPTLGNDFYGLEATLDVYNISLGAGQMSAAQISIYNEVNGIQNGVQVGWQIFPDLYPDSNTHFYTFWWSGEDHCFNDGCSPGFKRKDDSTVAPGDTLDVSVIGGEKRYITIRLFKMQCLYRAPSLKSLRLISYNVSDSRLKQAITKFTRLEELELSLCSDIFDGLSNDRFYRKKGVDDREAMGIAAMRGLRSLQLFASSLSNDGLAAILDNCVYLESLDIRHCFNVEMDDEEMRVKCARIKTLRLPDDSMEDYDLCFCSPNMEMEMGSMLDYSFRGDILFDSW